MASSSVSANKRAQAAGRDINNNSRLTVLQFSQSPYKPESQLQAEFAQRTGIWCPKPAREWLEHLMEEHRFTAKELIVAWKAGSLGWNAERDVKKIVTPWIEAVFGYGVAGAMSILFLAWVFPFIFGQGYKPETAWAAVLGGGTVFLGVCWMSNRFMLWPRRIALRVRRVSQESANA